LSKNEFIISFINEKEHKDTKTCIRGILFSAIWEFLDVVTTSKGGPLLIILLILKNLITGLFLLLNYYFVDIDKDRG